MRINYKRVAKILVGSAIVLPPTLWFAAYERLKPPAFDPKNLPKGDVIAVVDTGDAGRVEAGFKLYEEGKVEWLLISGVDPKVAPKGNKKRFASHFYYGELIRDLSRVDMDYAEDTHANAAGTISWLNTLKVRYAKRHRLYNIRHVVLITSYPHMPRATYILTQAMQQAGNHTPILRCSVGGKLTSSNFLPLSGAIYGEGVKLAVTFAGLDRAPWVQAISSEWHVISEKIDDLKLAALNLLKSNDTKPPVVKPSPKPAKSPVNPKLVSMQHKISSSDALCNPGFTL